MKKFGLIGGALIVGVAGAFASVANARSRARPPPRRKPLPARRMAIPAGGSAVPPSEWPNSKVALTKPTRMATAS